MPTKGKKLSNAPNTMKSIFIKGVIIVNIPRWPVSLILNKYTRTHGNI